LEITLMLRPITFGSTNPTLRNPNPRQARTAQSQPAVRFGGDFTLNPDSFSPHEGWRQEEYFKTLDIIQKGTFESLKPLVKQRKLNINFEAPFGAGLVPLAHFTAIGDTAAVKRLIALRAKIEAGRQRSAFEVALGNYRFDLAKLFANFGANINLKRPHRVFVPGEDGSLKMQIKNITPLMKAAECGDMKKLWFLLELGADASVMGKRL
jgi:hypothetical protein